MYIPRLSVTLCMYSLHLYTMISVIKISFNLCDGGPLWVRRCTKSWHTHCSPVNLHYWCPGFPKTLLIAPKISLFRCVCEILAVHFQCNVFMFYCNVNNVWVTCAMGSKTLDIISMTYWLPDIQIVTVCLPKIQVSNAHSVGNTSIWHFRIIGFDFVYIFDVESN